MFLKLKYLTFILLLVYLQSCRDKNSNGINFEPVYYRFPIDSMAKAYFWANEGSYWIYQNTKTGELDTQVVTHIDSFWVQVKGSFETTKHRTIDYERILKITSSSYFKWIYRDRTAGFAADYTLREDACIVDRLASGEGVNVPFFYPFKIGSQYGDGNSITTCISIDTSLIVNNIHFKNVTVFETKLDGIDEDKLYCKNPTSLYYWAKGIGLIRKELRICDYTWNLIEYEIK